jgi:DNA-binding transcriptional LysR family regulator
MLLARASEAVLSSVERTAASNSMSQWLSTWSSTPAWPSGRRRAHPLADRQAVYWIDLKNETALLSRRDPGPELDDLLIAKTASPGDKPKKEIVRHDVSRGSLMSLVGAGFGITLLTEASAGAVIAGLVYREVREGVEPVCISYSARWREDNQNPALTSFVKVLGERYPLPTADV